MPLLTVKNARTTDIPTLARLGWQTFFDTFHHDNTKEDMEAFLRGTFTRDIVEKEFHDSNKTYILALLGREAVGYAKLRDGNQPDPTNPVNCLEIAQLYAVKEKIGSGVGSALMQYCIATASERNKDQLWLGVWENNQRAIQFYRRFGFEKFGEHPFMLGSDRQNDWLMRKWIKPVESKQY